jgi:hypothetical protein
MSPIGAIAPNRGAAILWSLFGGITGIEMRWSPKGSVAIDPKRKSLGRIAQRNRKLLAGNHQRLQANRSLGCVPVNTSNRERYFAGQSCRMPVKPYLASCLADDIRHHPCAEALTSRRYYGRPAGFSPAKDESSNFWTSPRNANSALPHRQSTVLDCIGRQFVEDHSNCLRCAWFKLKREAFDSDARAVPFAVGGKFFGDNVMQFGTGPARLNK